MKTKLMWKTTLCALFVGIAATSIALEETPAPAADAKQDGAETILIDDCEDMQKQADDHWKLVGWHRNPSVKYVYDEDRKSRAVEFKATPRYFKVGFTRKDVADFLLLHYSVDVDELINDKLLKNGVITKDDKGTYHFPPKIMTIVDRYQMLAHLKTLPVKFSDDETAVTIALWASRHMIRQPRYEVKIDRKIAKDDEVELQWAMRFDPKLWTSRSFVVIMMIKGTKGSKKYKYYLKETHVIDMETQGEEPGYVKSGRKKRDHIFYWRLLDQWKKEPGPVRRGQYSRCFLDAQVEAQTPVKGWYNFRCNLTEDIKNSKRIYSRDRNGKIPLQPATLEEIHSIHIDAADCRMDDIKLIIRKKK